MKYTELPPENQFEIKVKRNVSVYVSTLMFFVILALLAIIFMRNQEKTQIHILDKPSESLWRETVPYSPVSVDGLGIFLSQALPLALDISPNKNIQSERFRKAEKLVSNRILLGEGTKSNVGAITNYFDNYKVISDRSLSQKFHIVAPPDFKTSSFPIRAMVTGVFEIYHKDAKTKAIVINNLPQTFHVEISLATDKEKYPYGLVLTAIGKTDAETKRKQLERIQRLLNETAHVSEKGVNDE